MVQGHIKLPLNPGTEMASVSPGRYVPARLWKLAIGGSSLPMIGASLSFDKLWYWLFQALDLSKLHNARPISCPDT
jgi:hypothetical protein